MHPLCKQAEIVVSLIRVLKVFVKGNDLKNSRLQIPQRLIQESIIQRSQGEGCNPGIRVGLSDKRRRGLQEFYVAFRMSGIHGDIGLVPDFIAVYTSLEMLYDRLNILFPWAQVGGNGIAKGVPVPVQGIPIAEAHPRLNLLLQKAVNNGIQPGKVILAFLFFRLGPAALDTGIAHAQLPHILFVRRELRHVPVQTFTADGPATGAKRGIRFEDTHLCERRRGLHEFLVCDGRPHLRAQGQDSEK